MSSVRIPPARPAPAPLPLAERVAIGNRGMADLRMQFRTEDQEIRNRLAGRPVGRCTALDDAIANTSKGYQAMLAECARNNARQPVIATEPRELDEEIPPSPPFRRRRSFALA